MMSLPTFVCTLIRARLCLCLHGCIKVTLCFAKVSQKHVHDPTPLGIKLGTVVDLQQLSVNIVPVIRPLVLFGHDLHLLLILGLLVLIFALLLLIFAGRCRR